MRELISDRVLYRVALLRCRGRRRTLQARLQASRPVPDEILMSALAISRICPLTIPRHPVGTWLFVWLYPVISRGLLNFTPSSRSPDLSCWG